MKIVLLQGSPRPTGNTARVSQWVMEEIQAAGHQAVSIGLANLNLGGCRECFGCQKMMDQPGCVLRDDWDQVAQAMLAADLIVLAAPVFCWSFPTPLKAVLDRCYCFWKFKAPPTRFLLAGRKFALILTAGGDEYDGAELCVATFDKFTQYAQAQVAGRLVIAHAGEPEDLARNEAVIARARAFGRTLAAAAGG